MKWVKFGLTGVMIVVAVFLAIVMLIPYISSPNIPFSWESFKQWFSDSGLGKPGKLALVATLIILAITFQKVLKGWLTVVIGILIVWLLFNMSGLIKTPGFTKWQEEAGNLPPQTETVTFQSTEADNCHGTDEKVIVSPDYPTFGRPGCHVIWVVRKDSPGDCVIPIVGDGSGNYFPTDDAVCKDTDPFKVVADGEGWQAAECETWLTVTYSGPRRY